MLRQKFETPVQLHTQTTLSQQQTEDDHGFLCPKWLDNFGLITFASRHYHRPLWKKIVLKEQMAQMTWQLCLAKVTSKLTANICHPIFTKVEEIARACLRKTLSMYRCWLRVIMLARDTRRALCRLSRSVRPPISKWQSFDNCKQMLCMGVLIPASFLSHRLAEPFRSFRPEKGAGSPISVGWVA